MVISPDQINLFTGVISFLFTLLIFSYVLGDNPLFRVAVYIFIGVSAGYIAVVPGGRWLCRVLFIPSCLQ